MHQLLKPELLSFGSRIEGQAQEHRERLPEDLQLLRVRRWTRSPCSARSTRPLGLASSDFIDVLVFMEYAPVHQDGLTFSVRLILSQTR